MDERNEGATARRAHAELSRRAFLSRAGSGVSLGALALLGLEREARGATDARQPAPRARRVIYLHMSGGPPQQDLFDPKPKLQALHGEPAPESLFEGKRLAFIRGHPTLLGSPHGFRRVGESGREVTELLPSFERIVDRLCIVRSMHTDQFNHAPAELKLFTGSPVFGAASMGAWASYGLGSLNENLPKFVALISGESDPTGGKSLFGSGFLPSEHQGVQLRTSGASLLGIEDPAGVTRDARRRTLDALGRLNRIAHRESGDPETLARVEQYELAFRMQTSVPEVMDLAAESPATLEAYGARPGKSSFAANCLLARRLVERGVRFVQLFDWGWDIHGTGPHDDLLEAFPKKCADIDRPVVALVEDLAARGLLEDTLVVFGGEFGRTAMNEARGGSTFLGRDHHPDAFTVWLAGGGVRAGLDHGATDEFGARIVEDPVSVGDLQATILHLCGFDPHHFSVFHRGLEQRLIGPDDAPRVRHEWLA